MVDASQESAASPFQDGEEETNIPFSAGVDGDDSLDREEMAGK